MASEIPFDGMAFGVSVLLQAASMYLVLSGLLAAFLLYYALTGLLARARWREATQHAYLPAVALARWARFRWKHPDCLYWILPVRFDRGDIVVEGFETEALYWNLTYYTWTEINGSVSSERVSRRPDGGFTIRLSKTAESGVDTIAVERSARFGVLYLRIYEPHQLFPTRLPRVTVGGRELTSGGLG